MAIAHFSLAGTDWQAQTATIHWVTQYSFMQSLKILDTALHSIIWNGPALNIFILATAESAAQMAEHKALSFVNSYRPTMSSSTCR